MNVMVDKPLSGHFELICEILIELALRDRSVVAYDRYPGSQKLLGHLAIQDAMTANFLTDASCVCCMQFFSHFENRQVERLGAQIASVAPNMGNNGKDKGKGKGKEKVT